MLEFVVEEDDVSTVDVSSGGADVDVVNNSKTDVVSDSAFGVVADSDVDVVEVSAEVDGSLDVEDDVEELSDSPTATVVSVPSAMVDEGVLVLCLAWPRVASNRRNRETQVDLITAILKHFIFTVNNTSLADLGGGGGGGGFRGFEPPP